MQSRPESQQSNTINKTLLLILILMTSIINPFMGAAINIALPKIGSEFSMNAVSMSWIAMSFLLASAIALVPIGKLADITGRKKIFLLGNIIITISSTLCAISTSGAMLITSRVIQGIGSAMVFGTGIAIVTSAFPPKERGKAIGINVSAVYLGLSAAPILGGILTQSLGWRSLFWVTIPIGLFVSLATIFFVKAEWAEAKNEKFDLKGSLVYMVAIFAFMFGFSKITENITMFITIAGFALLILFIFLEMRTEYPILNIQLFAKNKVFAFSNLAALINYAATFAVAFILSLYLQYIKGLNPRDAGFILVIQPVFMAFFASLAGRLSDKYDPRILSSTGMAITVVGLVLLTFLSDSTSTTYLIVSLAVLGIGFGLFSSPNTNAVMSSVEKKYLGVASATVGTMRLTGQMISMGIAAMIIQVFVGKELITPKNHDLFLQAVSTIFIVFALLCFIGVFASLARGKRADTNS